MRVLVTGGAGFIGSNLLRYWAREHPGDELVTLDALTYAGHRESIRDLEDERRVTFVRGDVADPAAVDPAVAGADAVVHLAAESHVDRSIDDPAPFLRTNVLGTQALLEAARRHDTAQVVTVSTDEVFGALPLDRPDLKFRRDSPYAPRSPYAASKAAADHLAHAYHATYGLPVVVTNCGNNFGPYQHPEKLIPRAVIRLVRGERIPLYGDGLAVRDWIYVEDHCRALDLVVHRGMPGQTYLVGADQERSNRDVARALLAAFGRGEDGVEYLPDRPGHDLRYALDSSHLRDTLGWRPRVAWEDGLRRTIAWYRANPEWWEPLLGGAQLPGWARPGAGSSAASR